MLKRLAVVAAAWLSAAMGSAPTTLPPIQSWAVFYGSEIPEGASLAAPDLLVLEPDHKWQPALLRRPGQLVLAYLSLGEVNASRSYFGDLQAVPKALLYPNPDWPGAWRVDPRHPAWRSLVLDHVAPALQQQGYDGYFLDTVDVGPWLEREKHQPGASAAMHSLIAQLKARDPAMRVVVNGGLDLLPQLAPSLDAVVVESVFTDYDFAGKRYRPREAGAAAERLSRLMTLRKQTGLPMLVIEYVAPGDQPVRARVAAQVRQAGLVPFVSDIGLSTLLPTP